MTSYGNGNGNKVIFKHYAVCQDYSLDAGRLYYTAGAGGDWVSLGQGVWVYPNPERLSVSIEGVGKRSISLSESELDAMDAVQFSERLREAGYNAPKGSAWYILDYVRSAVDSGTAVTPYGTRSANCWPADVFSQNGSRHYWTGAHNAVSVRTATAG